MAYQAANFDRDSAMLWYLRGAIEYEGRSMNDQVLKYKGRLKSFIMGMRWKDLLSVRRSHTDKYLSESLA